MNRPQTLKVLALAVAGLAAFAPPSSAQSVVLISGFFGGVYVENAAGEKVAVLDSLGNLEVGGNGQSGDALFYDSGNNRTGVLRGQDGDLILGGGSDDGDIILRDTDGTTTTIHMQGEFGFIQLGSPDDDGDLRLWDNDPDDEFSINLDGATGNVTNQLGGNGLVKAWAVVKPDGTVVSCWRCDPSRTLRNDYGDYTVSFAPVGNLRGRPMQATLDARVEVMPGGLPSDRLEIAGEITISGGALLLYEEVQVLVNSFYWSISGSTTQWGRTPRDSGFTIVVY